MKILLKFWQKGKNQPITRHGANPRVLTQKLASANFEKAYLKVSYGRGLNVFGKMTEFLNEGEYFTKQDLKLAFRAFCEEGIK